MYKQIGWYKYSTTNSYPICGFWNVEDSVITELHLTKKTYRLFYAVYDEGNNNTDIIPVKLSEAIQFIQSNKVKYFNGGKEALDNYINKLMNKEIVEPVKSYKPRVKKAVKKTVKKSV